MKRFLEAVALERPCQVVGVPNGLCALLARKHGFAAIYLSGAGVANSLGLPDLAVIGLGDVLSAALTITARVDLPLMVDIDTGLGPGLAIERTVRELGRVGVQAVHLEDQTDAKRCGQLSGKRLVSIEKMVDRISLAKEGAGAQDVTVVARTDALAEEGLDGAAARGRKYREAGAEMLFVEGAHDLSEYTYLREATGLPVIANVTEFGVTPLFSREALAAAGVDAILYPLTAQRAMTQAADEVYRVLRHEGSQALVLSQLQTRDELYALLDYGRWEALVDRASELE